MCVSRHKKDGDKKRCRKLSAHNTNIYKILPIVVLFTYKK